MAHSGVRWQDSSTADVTAVGGARAAPLAQRLGERAKWPALGLTLLLLSVTLALWAANLTMRREQAAVNIAGNVLFISVSAFAIAVIGIRGFLRSGAWPVLWMGAGAMAFGVAVALGSALVPVAGTNAAVTIHNLSALVAGMLHCLAAFFAANHIAAQESGPWRRSIVWQVYGGALVILALITLGAVLGVLPHFFEQGVGGTPLRQMVVALDVVLFALAGLIFLGQYRTSRALMLYWYALGLLLTALGLGGILMITATGTPLNWTGRFSQWIGGLYLLLAAAVTWSEARVRRISPDEVLASYFAQRGDNLRLLFNSIQDAIIVTDQDFVVTGWNRGAAAIYGWSADEVLGRPLAEIVRTEYAEGASRSAAIADLLAAGSSQTEVIQRHRSGRAVAVLASVAAVKDEAGRVVGAVAVNRDISERRRADEEIKRLNADLARRAAELEASNGELEAFAYSVSHDLRAPLRGVDGFALALQEDYAERLDDAGREYLRMLRQNAQRMGQLIDDLLSLSRVGRAQLQPQTVRHRELVQRVWNDLRPEWAGRSVEFRLGPLPDVAADATLLKQVYVNLLGNALKFSRGRDRAVIEVGARFSSAVGELKFAPTGAAETGANETPVFYVRDNGAGFDPQYAEKLFGVFQRLHRAEDYEGTGVGLAIVQRIVQRHGGRVWAEGRVGEGATLYFTLGGATGERSD